MKPKKRLSRREALLRKRFIQMAALERYTHAEIASALGVDRSAVTYYLGPRCKVG